MDMFSGRMLRRETKTLEQGSLGKWVKRAGSQGECGLIIEFADYGTVLFFAHNLSVTGGW